MLKKEEIRKEALKRRNAISKEDQMVKSEKIEKKVISLPQFQSSPIIFCYMQAKSEVDTDLIIEECWKSGKRVFVPKVFGDVMEFYEIFSFDDVEKGTFGIREPKDESIPGADVEEALMVVPGVSFDRTGNRVGYGKGYYDKYLSHHPKFYTVGIAFETQIVEKVPAEKTDYLLSLVLTEND